MTGINFNMAGINEGLSLTITGIIWPEIQFSNKANRTLNKMEPRIESCIIALITWWTASLKFLNLSHIFFFIFLNVHSWWNKLTSLQLIDLNFKLLEIWKDLARARSGSTKKDKKVLTEIWIYKQFLAWQKEKEDAQWNNQWFIGIGHGALLKKNNSPELLLVFIRKIWAVTTFCWIKSQ